MAFFSAGTPNLKPTEDKLEGLNNSINKLNKSTQISSWVMIVLTVIIVILTVVLIYQGIE